MDGMRTALMTALGALCFMVLDGLWLGLVMKDFYRAHLAPIARMADGGFAPNWLSAVVVYLALGAATAFFAVPRATSLATAAGYGALLGLVTYAVYDFTNHSTLREFPLVLALVDVAWGTVAMSITAVIVWATIR
jgi:uncharacterized membrane protein